MAMPSFSLITKVNLASIGLLLLGGGAFLAVALSNYSQSAHQALFTKGVEIATIAAKNSEYAIYTQNKGEFESISADLLLNQSLVRVEIRNQEHNLLFARTTVTEQSMPTYKRASSALIELGQVVSEIYDLAGNSTEYSVIEVPVFDAPVFDDDILAEAGDITPQDISRSEKNNIIGYIRIALSQADLHRDISEFFLRMIFVGVMIFITSAFLNIYIIRIISKPLARLNAATEDISSGDFDNRLVIETNDEFGELGRAFNAMADSLQSSKKQVQEYQRTLEVKIEERTEELSVKNERLEVVLEEAESARENAEQANRAKSEFLATMSHEIRTPLNGVLGMTDILSRTELNNEQKRFLDVISSSSDALLGLISDILDFSKIEAGKLELNYSRFDLREFLEELVCSFAGLAQEKDVELICHVVPQCSLIVEGDSARLRQVLSNLIGNALKFTSEGTVKLRVDLMNKLENDQATLRFEVEDTGIGIEKENAKHIFEKFRQADGSTTRVFGGTGLGLAIGRSLINAMGGDIFVDSEMGKGSTFWFDLTMPAEDKQQYLNGRNAGVTGLRVLIADDLAINREIIKDQLSAWGASGFEVEGGSECIQALQLARQSGANYDVLILDYHMPGMDGLEVARHIRQDSSLRGLKIIMLSSVSDTISPQEARSLGIDSRLLKPVRQSDLYNSLMDLAGANSAYKTGVPKRRKPRPEVSPEKTGVETFNKIAAHVAPRVLLAEDAPVNQEVALLMLDSLGCDTTLAENGREALDACQSQQFDLVFMDCQMPEMDGYEATRAIRQFENNEGKNTSLPVVALTANVVDGDREACIVAGMDDYLSKPFTRDKLAAVLEKWIVDYNPLSRESAAELAVADSTIDSPVSNGATFPIDQNLIESLGGVALLDPSVLEKYVEMDPDGTKGLLQRVLSVYLNTLPDYLVNTTTAGREQDVDQLREVAHSLKSGSENVGAMRIAALSREIEARARDNSIQGVDELLELLESTCQETTKVFVERYPAA